MPHSAALKKERKKALFKTKRDREIQSRLVFGQTTGLHSLDSESVSRSVVCDPMDCSPPGSSVHETLQAGMLEWVAIPFFKGSSQPRDQTQVSCIAGRFFTI